MTRDLLITSITTSAALADSSANEAVPLFFIANRGQAPSQVQFMAQGSGLTAYFSPGEALFRICDASLRVQFIDASPSVYLLNNCRNVEGRTETGAGASAVRLKHFWLFLFDSPEQIAPG